MNCLKNSYPILFLALVWVGCSKPNNITPEQAAKAERIERLREKFVAEAERRAATRREEEDKWRTICSPR